MANTRLLGRGVDCELFNPKKRNIALRQSWGLQSDEDAAAIFVSRIAAEKISLAIEAFKQIKRTRPDISCIFVGDGPENYAYRNSTPNLNLSACKRASNYRTTTPQRPIYLSQSNRNIRKCHRRSDGFCPRARGL